MSPPCKRNEAVETQDQIIMSNDEDLRRAISALRARDGAQIGRLVGSYVQKHAENVAGLRLLATTSMEVILVDDAARLLKLCLNRAPEFDLARLDHSKVLLRLRRFDGAFAEIDQLLAKSPGKSNYLLQKADILVAIGEFEPAIDIYHALVHELPDQSKIKMSLGNSLKTVGKQPEAIAAYRGAIANYPSLGVAYWSLANLKTFQFTEAEIEAMKHQLDSDTPTGADLYHLYFALGSALEDREDYEGGFEAFSQANKAKRKQVRPG